MTPTRDNAKSLSSTPVTGSLKVTVYVTLVALVSGPGGVVRLIDWTTGAAWSNVYCWPAESPLPAPGPPGELPAASRIESSSARFSPSVPSPLIPLTVTV